MNHKKLEEMAAACTEWHGCASGDCPHDTYRECFNAIYVEAGKDILNLPEVKAMKEALEFYGNKESWHQFISGGNIANEQDGDFMQCFDTPNNDDGEVARRALADLEGVVNV